MISPKASYYVCNFTLLCIFLHTTHMQSPLFYLFTIFSLNFEHSFSYVFSPNLSTIYLQALFLFLFFLIIFSFDILHCMTFCVYLPSISDKIILCFLPLCSYVLNHLLLLRFFLFNVLKLFLQICSSVTSFLDVSHARHCLNIFRCHLLFH